VFYWLAAAAFLGSFWIGRKTIAQRLLEAAFEGAELPQRAWRRANAAWVAFNVLMGGLNLLVAFYASERAWVNFKFFGLTGLTFVFGVAQVALLMRHAPREGRSSEART